MKLFLILALFIPFISQAEITLSDIGVKEETVSSDPNFSATEMKLRKSKLQTHQILGLVTLGAMTTTLLTGGSGLDNDFHMYMGMATGALYFTTAYYSLTAPKPLGTIDRGRVKWHKALAWIHFPAMILTPIMGYLYKKNKEDDRKLGLEKHHPTMAGILYGSFALSASLMLFEF